MDEIMEDVNKCEHLGQITEGCQSGQHLWDEREGHSTVETDGELTKIKMLCLVCHRQFDISALFGLNRFIGTDTLSTIEKPNNINQSLNWEEKTTMNDYIEQSEILKRILG